MGGQVGDQLHHFLMRIGANRGVRAVGGQRGGFDDGVGSFSRELRLHHVDEFTEDDALHGAAPLGVLAWLKCRNAMYYK